MNLVPVVLLGAAAIRDVASGPAELSPAALSGAKALIDNPRVTICDVTWSAGQKWAMQNYALDTLVVPVTPVSLRDQPHDGKATTVNLKPGEVRLWPKGTQQEVEPASDGRAIVAHFKDVAGQALQEHVRLRPGVSASPCEAAPRQRSHRRVGLHVGSGGADANHFHDKDLMIVYLADGAIRSVTPDGKATPNEFKFAEVRFNPGNRAHYEEYVRGNGPRAVITELK